MLEVVLLKLIAREEAKQRFAGVGAAMAKCEKAFLGLVGKTDPDSVKKKAEAKEEFSKSVNTSVDHMLESMKLGRLDVYRGLVLGLTHEADADKEIVKSAKALQKAIEDFDKAKPDVVTVLENDIGKREKEIKSAQRNKLLGGILLAVVGAVIACLGFNSMLNKLAEARGLEGLSRALPLGDLDLSKLLTASNIRDSASISGAVGLIGGIGGVLGYILATESKDAGKIDDKIFAESVKACKTNGETLLTAVQEFVQALPREMSETVAPEFVKALEEQRLKVEEAEANIGK